MLNTFLPESSGQYLASADFWFIAHVAFPVSAARSLDCTEPRALNAGADPRPLNSRRKRCVVAGGPLDAPGCFLPFACAKRRNQALPL